MDLKVELTVHADISLESELEAVNKWNIDKSDNQIYYIKGYLENYKGNVDIVSEKFSIQHSYLYSGNPTIAPSAYFSLDGSVVNCDIDCLDNFIGESKSVVIGAMLYAETLALSKQKEDFSWIKVKKYDETKYPTIEEKYEALQRHHKEEVDFLINYIKQNCKK